ncbi:MAG: TolC family protein [Muribaculaceae bacterium]|nr:TolC family protein [Muribaculaceae bacterium]
MNRTIATLTLCLVATIATSQTTLQQCQQAAERNYPLIRQYDLIARTTDLTVSNIGKAWLPQVSASAQATWQSAVTAWPEQMQAMLSQMGTDIKGLKKDQYRVGIDVNQTLYDGGAIGAQQAIAREQGAVQAAQTEVTLYAVRQRASEMYYGLLLLDDQLRLNADLQTLLASSEKKLASLYKRGAAAECDYLAVKAERLNAMQQQTSLQSQRQTLARMLSAFCGIEVTEVVKPNVAEVGADATNRRPELRLADAQLRLADAQERELNSRLMPRLNLFASGFYGYPGYNMFEDMMRHKWSLNAMVGARLTWNIGALYTRKNDKAKIELQRASAQNSRDVFLFNNRLEQAQQTDNIVRYRQMVATDDEIIQLRSSVRKAAESKLAHGIIDVNDLIKEINAENAARVQQSIHQIEWLKAMSDLKITINN